MRLPAGRFELRSAFALRRNSGKIIFYFAFVALCGALQTPFHRMGRYGHRHRLLSACGCRAATEVARPNKFSFAIKRELVPFLKHKTARPP